MPDPLPPTCPWSPLRALFGLPNVNWCEASVCGWLEEPANAVSNLAYVLAAATIWLAARKLRPAEQRREHRLLGDVVATMGVCSLIYHASNNFATQLLDFLGMFLYVSLLLTYNIRRLRGEPAAVLASDANNGSGLPVSGALRLYAALLVTNLTLLYIFPRLGLPIQMIILCNTILILGTELTIYIRTRQAHAGAYRVYGAAMLLLVLASVASLVDLRRLACAPHSPVWQGHAIWHVLSAASTALTAAFYRRLRAPGSG